MALLQDHRVPGAVLGRWSLLTIGACAAAGFGAGLLTGVAARLAMRLIAVATVGDCAAMGTHRGHECGAITITGTLQLLLLAGLVGLIGGVLWAGSRSWIPGASAFGRGLTFGAVLMAVGGWIVFDPGSADFERFGPPVLDVMLFATLFPVFGVSVALLASAFERALLQPRSLRRAALTRRLVRMAAAVAIVFSAVVALSAINGPQPTSGIVLAYALAVPPAVRFGVERLGEVGRGAAAAGYALLAVPLALGGVVTLANVAAIV